MRKFIRWINFKRLFSGPWLAPEYHLMPIGYGVAFSTEAERDKFLVEITEIWESNPFWFLLPFKKKAYIDACIDTGMLPYASVCTTRPYWKMLGHFVTAWKSSSGYIFPEGEG